MPREFATWKTPSRTMKDVLRVTAELPDLSFAALARELCMSRGHFCDTQSRLIDRGLLSADGRTVLGEVPPIDEGPIELTDHGRLVVNLTMGRPAEEGCDNVSH
jgi:hypothetical protein